MPNIRTKDLTLLSSVDAAVDAILIEDISANETKKTTANILKTSMLLDNVDNTSDVNKPISTATQAALDGKVDENAAITGATKTKITYDSKGLVTAGADLSASDMPTGIDAAKIGTGVVDNTEFGYLNGVTSAIQTQLNAKQGSLTLTTTGSSGAATLVGNTLNIPQYTGGSGSGVSSLEGLSGALQLVAGSNITITDNGTDSITIAASGSGSLSVDANEGLTLVSNSLGTIYNSTIGDSVNSVAVGGATAQPASFWKSKTLVQVLDTILFPTILASIKTNKSVDLTISGSSGTLEVGQTISRVLTATFNRGAIFNGDGTTNPNPLVGAATQYTFTGTGISSTSQAGNTLSISNVIANGTNNWAVTVDHDAGTGDYYDNKGNVGTNLNASRVSGTATDSTSSPSVTGVYPWFYLKSSSPITASDMASAIAAGTATKVVASSTGTLAVPYNVSAQYLAVAYPAASTTKTVYYVTALDNGAITVVFEAVTTESVNSPDGYWSSQSYKVHVSKSALTNSNPTIELRNS